MKKIKLLITITFLLSACNFNRIETPDGPPLQDIDVKKIPNAIPKKEAPCRYGNQATYSVNGKTYHVLPTSQGYRKVGLASWYGKKFDGHRTSCGEAYDMLAMTAASKTLPLPTYVKVVNIMNNHEVIVKINDRGPFHPNRIIDLSYAAAKKLGMIGTGTTLVEVIALSPEDGDYVPEVRVKQPIQRYLQSGAFHNRDYAEAHVNQLKKALADDTVPVKLKQDHSLFRVLVGPFIDAAQYQHVKAQLMALSQGHILEVFS